jgi:hypothetical protein
MQAEFWWGVLKEKDILGDVGVNGRLVSEWTSKKFDERIWTGLIWRRIRASGGLLRTW